jgi:hypothetical protein
VQSGRAAQQRVVAVTVGAGDPPAMARRWAEVLGLAAPQPHGAGWRLALDRGNVDFVAPDARGEGIVGYALAVHDCEAVRARARELGLPGDGNAVTLMGARIDLIEL